MIRIASKRRGHAPPPQIIAPMLMAPTGAPWLTLLPGEVSPTVLYARLPGYVRWSSLWPELAGSEIDFDLTGEPGAGTDLRWTLWVPGPLAVDLVWHARRRLNYLINAQLRAELDY